MAKLKAKIRLDKMISKCTGLTRSEATRALKNGYGKINNIPQKSGKVLVDLANDEVVFDDEILQYREQIYIMMHKPKGYVCAAKDERLKTVLELLPASLASREPFSCGRLDIDTTGLVILTDDGTWAHGITSPKRKCEKSYLVGSAGELSQEDMQSLEEGLYLDEDDKITAPAKIERLGEKTYRLKITEGRYHQVKRMFESVNNMVKSLHREQIGDLALDPELPEGEWRDMSPEEVELFK
ncbi:pseudouridine synthase [Lentisphaera profundi]|uniref:Pseudouridine synthase n=1 Tax=Lentisphaera profundi TaxID=1658616 RepID=A0ABY7VPA6_9BACT|nr:pseudouridine synthase [Lentisphaera profundi]WDE95641.1 pseudouridine synthase [Lentisphaera profundi]